MLYNRDVMFSRGREAQLTNEVKALSSGIKEKFLAICDYLVKVDPDIDERCGLLGDQYELFVVKLGKLGGTKILISINRKKTNGDVVIHSIKRAQEPCKALRLLVIRDFKPSNSTWEPKNEC